MKREDVVRRHRNGRIDILPDLLPQPKRKENHEINSSRLRIAGENASFLACYLYEVIFGGMAITPSEKYPDEDNGHPASFSRFRPDHILQTPDGTVTTEVKMTSFRSSQPFCYNGQFFNYYRDFLNRLRSGEETPMFNYALFNYGTRDGLKIGRFTNNDLARIISKQVNSLTVLPANAVLFLFLHSRFEEPDQSLWRSGAQRGYWRPGRFDVGDLHGQAPLDAVKRIRKRHSEEGRNNHTCKLTTKELYLEDIIAERFHSPRELYIEGGHRQYRVTPFPITVYRNPNPKAVAERLGRRFERIKLALGGDPNEYLHDRSCILEEPVENGDTSFDYGANADESTLQKPIPF